MRKLAERAQKLSPSPTLSVDTKAKELLRQGERVINFGAGEPDFDTPEHIKEAAKRALDQGFTKYTPVAGILPLREAICEKLYRDNQLEYSPNEIVVSCGAKHSIFNALQVLLDPGDEVIIPVPYWTSYPEQVKLAGGVPVFVPTSPENDFKLRPEDLRAAVTPRTRLLILNSPANPTGTVYRREELIGLAEVALEADLWILSDEIYEKLIYDGMEHVSIAALDPEVKKRTIVVNGVSKAYAMTGWRIGYAAAPRPIAQAMTNLQSHSTSNPTSVAQAAALAALKGPQEPVENMRRAFQKRRDFIWQYLNSLPGVRCPKPLGAFYVFPEVSGLLGRRLKGREIATASDLALFLLEEIKVATVAGAAFGDDRYLRFSYALRLEDIEEGMQRFKELIEAAL
ncbi:aminotransferase class I and II [Ammonifex degensii KC4]|uniref:Aminotransferase n=1 Tax=Ammonifex degensii (strain DSM 10501 / KC4) TaxID=429009 RepID=C9R853_AMMDK|nr:pyridoxal phosphate-dependent aminotransferase [Ammonifex degensii]ACX52482.1 aminotransferase class I and II [Ammonifex degensii KC4]